ncbi:hypothetical protein Agabi119p4_8973 [Agaricus bisporus var. burnettii]|uniref:Uncharacterized protein n=1 Tax=Agaricus bisporus var. burnettii TaxID=192524 RepID=A0A8H7C5D8_AGABI|nr:hypothetical protein Agabi119p4_8973 [Agaricus bisporus var. burnettii]
MTIVANQVEPKGRKWETSWRCWNQRSAGIIVGLRVGGIKLRVVSQHRRCEVQNDTMLLHVFIPQRILPFPPHIKSVTSADFEDRKYTFRYEDAPSIINMKYLEPLADATGAGMNNPLTSRPLTKFWRDMRLITSMDIWPSLLCQTS